MSLSGSIPSEIGRLTNLVVLRVDENVLGGWVNPCGRVWQPDPTNVALC